MISPFSRRVRRECGVFLPLYLLIFFVILAILGLAVDLASYFRSQSRLQKAVDAGALAAANLQGQAVDANTDLDLLKSNIKSAAESMTMTNLRESAFSPEQIVGTPQVDVFGPEPSMPPPGTPVRGPYTTVSAKVKPPSYIMDMIPWIGKNTILQASAEAETRSAIISVVLDTSNSMNTSMSGYPGTKFEALKEAATKFISALGDSRDMVSLTTFNYSARIEPPFINDYWDTPQQIEQHRDQLIDTIAALSLGAKTNTSEGILKGFESIRDKTIQYPFLPCYMMLFTDGSPTTSTVNWVPSSAGSPNFAQYPDPANAPAKWYSFRDDQGNYTNHWGRSVGGSNTNFDRWDTDKTSIERFEAPGNSWHEAGGSIMLLANALGLHSPISFRTPGDYNESRLYTLFDTAPVGLVDVDDDNDSGDEDENKLDTVNYVATIAMADYVRTKACTIFVIGLGYDPLGNIPGSPPYQPPPVDDFYNRMQSMETTDVYEPRKDYLLSRVANDPSCGELAGISTCLDQPDHYVDTYQELAANNAPRGKYYPTEDPGELSTIFLDVLANIRLRLNH